MTAHKALSLSLALKSLGDSLDAARLGDRFATIGGLLDFLMRLANALGRIDIDKIMEFIKQLIAFLEQIGIISPPTATATVLTQVDRDTVSAHAAAGLFDLDQLLALVELILQLIDRFRR